MSWSRVSDGYSARSRWPSGVGPGGPQPASPRVPRLYRMTSCSVATIAAWTVPGGTVLPGAANSRRWHSRSVASPAGNWPASTAVWMRCSTKVGGSPFSVFASLSYIAMVASMSRSSVLAVPRTSRGVGSV